MKNASKTFLKLVFFVPAWFTNCIFGPENDIPKLQITEKEKQILLEFFEANGRSDVSLDRSRDVETNADHKVVKLSISRFPKDQEFLIIPPSFLELTSLNTIEISLGGFRDVPVEFSQLTSLKRLEIYSIPIREITENIVSISSLEFLVISSCPLDSITSNISQLANLRELSITYSNINTIPEGIFSLPNLNSLNLSFNKIRSLPDEILSKAYDSFLIHNNYLCSLTEQQMTWLTQYPRWQTQNCN